MLLFRCWIHLCPKRKKVEEGGSRLIRFEDVFEDKEEVWQNDQRFVGDDVGTFCIPTSEVRRINHAYFFKKRWNNPNNINSPYSYFDGKLVPDHVDDNGNVVYRYVTHPYEKSWKKEGLLWRSF